jgi:hypothetical protein
MQRRRLKRGCAMRLIIGMFSALAFAVGNVGAAELQGTVAGPNGDQFHATLGLPGTCLWASRVFSDGAIFCIAKGASLKCQDGKWTLTASGGASIACDGIYNPVDTK